MKGELSVEVGSSTEKDGKAAKNAWPELVSINVLTGLWHTMHYRLRLIESGY